MRKRYPITKKWQRDTRARIAALGLSFSEFARRIGVPPASLSYVISQPAESSGLVCLIERHLPGYPSAGPKIDEHW